MMCRGCWLAMEVLVYAQQESVRLIGVNVELWGHVQILQCLLLHRQ